MDSVQERIKFIRTDANLSQAEFAEVLNISRNSVGMIERGQQNPGGRTLADICDKFNVNPAWLRAGEGEPYRELTPEERVAKVLGDVIKGNNYARNRLIVALAELIRLKDEAACRVIEDNVIRYAAQLEATRRMEENRAARQQGSK